MGNEFQPDWASPPGDTILGLLIERGYTVARFVRQMRISETEARRLLRGDVPLDERTAVNLTAVFGASAEFWLTREAQYREDLSRMAAAIRARGEEPDPLGTMEGESWGEPRANLKRARGEGEGE